MSLHREDATVRCLSCGARFTKYEKRYSARDYQGYYCPDCDSTESP
jgi:Zn finger protein HypA/HybF involved in hydrogenase expression